MSGAPVGTNDKAWVFRGDRRVDAVDPMDRGLAYGDGLFETLRSHRGALPWWQAHWARLCKGASVLGLPVPDETRVHDAARTMLGGGDAVLKLLLTRGVGGRGYAPQAAAEPAWILSMHALPPAVSDAGLAVQWCRTQWALQPVLAGLKHCNRLEQVLARGEILRAGPAVDEGLVCSTGDDVVSATSGNVFVLLDGQWWTPRVDRCGVAGVCRAWVLGTGLAGERRLSRGDVEAADAVFLCNAVRGILPVARLGTRCWAPHPRLAALQARLAAEVPAFAPESS